MSPHRIIPPLRSHLSLSQHNDASHHDPTPSCTLLPPSNYPLLLLRLPDFCRCCTLSAVKISFTVTHSCSYATFCLHHGTQSLPPPSYHVSCANSSKIVRVATHFATVSCRLSTYVLSVYVPAPHSTDSASTFRKYPSLRCVYCLRVICLKKITCDPSNL